MNHAHPRPAVFLDRDGTLIEDRGHIGSPSQVVLFPDTIDALHKLQDVFLLFIVTNQPGVAKGVISVQDVDRVNIHLLDRLAESEIKIAGIYTCPHSRVDNCACIKPRPYFLRKAAADFHLDLRRSFVVGDHPHDIALARNAGAIGVYVCTGHGMKHLGELPADEVVVPGIQQAVNWILSHRHHTGAT